MPLHLRPLKHSFSRESFQLLRFVSGRVREGRDAGRTTVGNAANYDLERAIHDGIEVRRGIGYG